LKYSGRQQLASLLADAVIQSLESLYVKAEAALMPDSVVVVPSSPGSIKQRGFHPVLAVADRVSRELVGRRVSLKEISGFRYTGDGVPQASLSHAMRVKKISGGYQASASVFSGKQVLIVEDVITTGATLYNAASALHSAGASRVDVLALARASNWQSSRQLVYQSFEKQSSPVR
jgi:predicted amidophosphoribosyltransferase